MLPAGLQPRSIGVSEMPFFTMNSQAIGNADKGWSVRERWLKPLSNNDLRLESNNPSLQCSLKIEPIPLENSGSLEVVMDPFAVSVSGDIT